MLSKQTFIAILVIVAAGGALFLGFIFSSDTKSPAYPEAKRITQTDVYHGVEVADPYRWLEDLESVETKEWVKAQDKLASDFLAGLSPKSALVDRLSELKHFDNMSIPTKTSGGYFFGITPAGENHSSVFMSKDMPGDPVEVLNPTKRLEKGSILSRYYPGSDGKNLAYVVAADRSTRWRTLRALNVESGDDYPEILTDLYTISSNVSWSPDNESFYYVTYEKPEDSAENAEGYTKAKVMYHRLGQPQDSDVLVFQKPDQPSWSFQTQVSEDGRYLILSARDGLDSSVRIFYKDLSFPGSPVIPLLDKADADYTFLGNEQSRFYFYTTLDAPRGRIIEVNIDADPASRITGIIPETEESIAGSSQVGGNAVGFYGGRFVALYFKDARSIIRIFSREGQLFKEIDMPTIGGTVWGGFTGSQYETHLIYRFLGPAEPASLYRLDLETAKSTVLYRPETGFDADGYVSEQVFYQSKDGTRIPMFLLHKKGLKKDGRNPVMMYGFGAYGWSSFLWYRPKVLLWLEMGGMYASPNIRGGGAYGQKWHEGGKGLNKQNAIDDFIAAGNWLIDNDYTTSSKLVLEGGGFTSGLVLCSAMNQHSDLFAGVLLSNPGTDMLRFIKFAGRSDLKDEFGSPDSPEGFKALYAYSPYHNLAEGKCYPAVLMRISENNVAGQMHANKFAAALQSLHGNCTKPVLLKMRWKADGLSTNKEVNRTEADELMFAAYAAGLNSK